ncbi:MAG: phosphate signaling complex protein PhoU [Spirochaetes bacterium]|jgi:phosphate transport system protein|nr:phosphate signaling complex protein PhoU [Spirochaetota bacterium]
MITHLEGEIEGIKKKIFTMTDGAIEAISNAIESLKTMDVKLAAKVIQNDTRIDKLEIQIDDDCVRTLVTQQPAASDLRLILSFIKINNDLERIADIASNIAKETIRLEGRPQIHPESDIPGMATTCINMIKTAFEAMTTKDVSMAAEIISIDREVDELNIQVYRELFTLMADNPQVMPQALGLIMVAKSLERIGDHAKNIAERVIYYIEGVDIRHEKS